MIVSLRSVMGFDLVICNFYCYSIAEDVIEEDALNEKYCVQVLRILMDKADEEIVKLEEDAVMDQCQLAWDDEDWSKPCSAALREKIDHFDVLIQSFKIGNTEDAHFFDVEKWPPRLHDLVKPLLENYSSAKIRQTKSAVPAAGPSKNNLGSMTSKHDDRKSLALEPDDKKMNYNQEEKDANVRKCISDAHKCAYEKLSENDKLSKQQEKKMPILAPARSGWRTFNKLELRKNSITRERSESSSTECRPLQERKATNSRPEPQETAEPADVISDIQLKCAKQISRASRKTQKARTNRCVINNNVVFTNPSVTTKRKRTKLSEQTPALEAQSAEMKDPNSDSLVALLNSITKLTGKPKVKVEPKIELLPVMPDITNLVFNPAKSVFPKDNQKFLAKEADTGSSSTRTSKGQKSHRGLKKSEDTITSYSSSQKKRKASQNIWVKKGIRNFLMKLEKSDDDNTIVPSEEATINHAVKEMPWISPLCIRDADKLLLNDLRVIAKNQKLPGYYKLRKAELQKRLGLHL